MKRNSIVFKTVSVVILIFFLMLLITNIAINKKNESLTEDIINNLEISSEGSNIDKENTIVVINKTYDNTIFDFRTYSLIVMGFVSVLGGGIFYLCIKKMLNPVSKLAEEIKAVDINNISEDLEIIKPIKGSSEVEELRVSFNSAFRKIYQDYKSKRDFSESVAHELKTPLAIIKARLDLFKKDPQDIEDFTQSMDKNLSRLDKLIESILILRENKTPNLTETDFRSLIEELEPDFINIYGSDIKIDILGDLNIKTDPLLIQRVIYNLLDNAFKYSKGKPVRVILSNEEKTFELIDQGPGVSDSDLENIFEIFYRADKSRSRDTGGYGIGLAIVKSIVAKLKGRIVARNLDKGMSFKIYF